MGQGFSSFGEFGPELVKTTIFPDSGRARLFSTRLTRLDFFSPSNHINPCKTENDSRPDFRILEGINELTLDNKKKSTKKSIWTNRLLFSARAGWARPIFFRAGIFSILGQMGQSTFRPGRDRARVLAQNPEFGERWTRQFSHLI